MSKPYNPAQEGIDAARADVTRERLKNSALMDADILCDRFKEFVKDSIQDGHHENFNTFAVFLESCFETFSDCELYNEEES